MAFIELVPACADPVQLRVRHSALTLYPLPRAGEQGERGDSASPLLHTCNRPGDVDSEAD